MYTNFRKQVFHKLKRTEQTVIITALLLIQLPLYAIERRVSVSFQQIMRLQVLDKQTGEPLAWATVFGKKTGYGVVADKNGFCELHSVAANDTLVISCIGYYDNLFPPGTQTTGDTTRIYLVQRITSSDPVTITANRSVSGYDLLEGFRKNFAANYPHQPISGYIYVNIDVRQDSLAVRNTDYVSAFYSPSGFASPVLSYDTLLKQRNNLRQEIRTVVPNPTTATLVKSTLWLSFLGLDVIPSFTGLNKKNTIIKSVQSSIINGVKIYKINASLTEPVIFTSRVSQVDLELFLNETDLSVVKYKLTYKTFFEVKNGESRCIDIKGRRVPYTTPAGFLYDSLINSKEIFYRKTGDIYVPFYCITHYSVNDVQIATGSRGHFTERREYFIYNVQLKETGHSKNHTTILSELIHNEERDDQRFWESFIKPDRKNISGLLDEME